MMIAKEERAINEMLDKILEDRKRKKRLEVYSKKITDLVLNTRYPYYQEFEITLTERE